jgi:hypothetical protein
MIRILRVEAASPLLLLPLLGAGCGPGLPLNDNVQGTVKMDGNPVANVRVEFLPQGGPEHNLPSSWSMTDEKGYYRLTCENGKPGAVVAKHKVVILAGRAAATPEERESGGPAPRAGPTIPVTYSIASQTPLEVEVKADESTYDLTVKR